MVAQSRVQPYRATLYPSVAAVESLLPALLCGFVSLLIAVRLRAIKRKSPWAATNDGAHTLHLGGIANIDFLFRTTSYLFGSVIYFSKASRVAAWVKLKFSAL